MIAPWNDPSHSPALPGLLWKGTSFEYDLTYFKCCEGKGIRWDAQIQAARTCRLQNRKRKVQKILDAFNETWSGSNFPQNITVKDQAYFLCWLRKFYEQQSHHGLLTSCQRDGGSPGFFWYLALLASWRFGFSTHVFSVGRSKDHEMIPFSIPAEEYPLIYFLDSVNELWKPKYKEQVSTIINWCEQSEVPLWIELREPMHSAKKGEETLDLKEAFRAYINKMKSRPILEWLDEECLSRLLRVCSKGAPLNFLKMEE